MPFAVVSVSAETFELREEKEKLSDKKQWFWFRKICNMKEACPWLMVGKQQNCEKKHFLDTEQESWWSYMTEIFLLKVMEEGL